MTARPKNGLVYHGDAVCQGTHLFILRRLCCATEREKGLGRHEALFYGCAALRPKVSRVLILSLFRDSLHSSRSTASAALTFDLRAVSGSQVTIHSPKSVAVNHNSVGGWIDFELWALVTGSNNTPADDWMKTSPETC